VGKENGKVRWAGEREGTGNQRAYAFRVTPAPSGEEDNRMLKGDSLKGKRETDFPNKINGGELVEDVRQNGEITNGKERK